MAQCLVCLNAYSTNADVGDGADGWGFRISCPICGKFDVTTEAFEDYLDPKTGAGSKLSTVCRARIAHKLRTAAATGPAGLPKLTTEVLGPFIKAGCPGPSPGEQANNAILFIGDEISRTGTRIEGLSEGFFASIGSPSPELAGDLLAELLNNDLLDGLKRESLSQPVEILHMNLTLRGWQLYEEVKKGKRSGNHGFLAMQFGDSKLDPLARDVIKPTVKSELNLDVFDMRDIARAGLIDNIMRAQIRDAAFVIVDLTHDNSGAYWEAGYGEGLGKPVIYLCERSKFEEVKTHFDTNHCTTVIWALDDLQTFKRQLVATIRRSLNLF